MKIMFRQEGGGVSILTPTQEALSFATIGQIAEKDVPAPIKVYDVPTGIFEIDEETGEEYEVMDFRLVGFPYKIISVDDIPTDRTYRAAWEWDDSIVPDGFGGESNEFDAELLAAYNSTGAV
jgi:hypothetical protein